MSQIHNKGVCNYLLFLYSPRPHTWGQVRRARQCIRHGRGQAWPELPGPHAGLAGPGGLLLEK